MNTPDSVLLTFWRRIIRQQIKGLIEELAVQKSASGSIAQKIGDLYNMAMDSTRRNADGMKPIKAELERIAAIRDRGELSKTIAEMRRDGFDPFFGLYVGSDDMNSAMNLIILYQSGISLGEREYYLDDDDHTREIREKYRQHVAKMFQLAGFSASEANKAASDVMTVETRLAESAK